MKKNIKRIVCLLFAVVFMFGTAFVSSAEEEYLTSFKVSETNSMTLTFGTSSGQTISVDLGAVLLMPDEEEGNIAAFISNDPDFGTVYVSYTVRVNSKKQNVYKFYLGELASNEIVETPFIKACDMAYLYLSLWVNYDAKGSDFTTVGFDGLMTTANVNNIVVFLMPVLYSHEYASSETLPVLPSVPGYKGVKISAAHKVVSEYFTMTEKQLKKSGCYDSFYVSQGLLLFPDVSVNRNVLSLMISVEKSGSQWICDMGYFTLDGDPITFTLTMNEKLQMIKSVSDKRFKAGDVNGDGDIDISDAMLLFYAVSKKVDLTPDERSRAMSNWDGAIDIEDAMALFYYVAKRTSKFFTLD